MSVCVGEGLSVSVCLSNCNTTIIKMRMRTEIYRYRVYFSLLLTFILFPLCYMRGEGREGKGKVRGGLEGRLGVCFIL